MPTNNSITALRLLITEMILAELYQDEAFRKSQERRNKFKKSFKKNTKTVDSEKNKDLL